MRKLFLFGSLIIGFISIIIIYLIVTSKVTTNLDNYIYELPFAEGSNYKVIQGYGGIFSHRNIAALDFGMPVGTPVFAAREGIIFKYKDDSDEGGPFPNYERKANFIIIKHPDGSFGCYWHLQKNGVIVKEGMVAKGQLIGYSGRTGFVLMPHLHFSVKLKLNYNINSYIRTKFRTDKGIEILESGKTYKRPKISITDNSEFINRNN